MTISETPTTAPPPPPAAPGPKPNGFQRIIGVLISPDETFASVARQPDFLAPLLLIIVLSAVGGFIFVQRVDFTAPAREVIEERGHVSEAEVQHALQGAA